MSVSITSPPTCLGSDVTSRQISLLKSTLHRLLLLVTVYFYQLPLSKAPAGSLSVWKQNMNFFIIWIETSLISVSSVFFVLPLHCSPSFHLIVFSLKGSKEQKSTWQISHQVIRRNSLCAFSLCFFHLDALNYCVFFSFPSFSGLLKLFLPKGPSYESLTFLTLDKAFHFLRPSQCFSLITQHYCLSILCTKGRKPSFTPVQWF